MMTFDTQTYIERATTGSRRLPRGILVPERRESHRPVGRFRLRLRTDKDILLARRGGVPVYLFEPWLSEALGYPLSFRPRLLVARDVIGAIAESAFPLLPFVDAEAARYPKVEDLIVAMLAIDPLGARRILRANSDRVDRVRLLRRIVREGVEEKATYARLQDLVPNLPTVGQSLPAREIRAQDAKGYSRGLSI